MCDAFSAIVKENGEVLWSFGIDSHEELITKNGLKDTEDRTKFMKFVRAEVTPANKNYLNPDTWIFRLDENVTPAWWSKAHEQWVFDAHKKWLKKLNKILVKREITNPFSIKSPKKITKKHLSLLKRWASVRADASRVRAGRVWASVGASVGAGVGVSVWASVWDNVGDSVGDSVGAYIGSFFKLPRKAWKNTEKIKGKGYPFQAVVDLWDLGLVPSFDGKVWRLHGGPEAKVLWRGKI